MEVDIIFMMCFTAVVNYLHLLVHPTLINWLYFSMLDYYYYYYFVLVVVIIVVVTFVIIFIVVFVVVVVR
jgi:hypothetical protein